QNRRRQPAVHCPRRHASQNGAIEGLRLVAVAQDQVPGTRCPFGASSPLRTPIVPCSWAPATGPGTSAGTLASGGSCQGWQPSVLNALSVGSIRTTCGFLVSELSIRAP